MHAFLIPWHKTFFQKLTVPQLVVVFPSFYGTLKFISGAGSVAIATGYGLDGPGIESRWEVRFSAPVQTGPGAHPASCTMNTGSFPG